MTTYAIWDGVTAGAKGSTIDLTNSNLTATNNSATANWYGVRGSIGKASGKHLVEFHKDNTGGFGGSMMGFCDGGTLMTGGLGATGNSGVWQAGAWVPFGTVTSSGAAPADGLIYELWAIDMDNKMAWVATGNTWANSGNPLTLANPSFTWTGTPTFYPVCALRVTALAVTMNSGQTAFNNNTAAATLVTGGYANGFLIATTAPGVPTIGTATAGTNQTTVTFTPPGSDGGSAITGYTVTSTPGSFTGTSTGSPITVTGLTNGTAYTFTVHATNAIGNSTESAASNSVTPSALAHTPVILSTYQRGRQ